MPHTKTPISIVAYLMFVSGLALSTIGATVVYLERVADIEVPVYYLTAFAPVSIGLILTAAGLWKIGKARSGQ